MHVPLAIRSRRGHLLRDTHLLELKLKFRRRWDEKSSNEYHIRGRRLIKIYLFCLGLLVLYPFDSICNSRWILLTEIHILFYRMIRVVIGTVSIVNSKNRRKLIERKEFYIRIRVFWELEELVIFVSPNIQWSSKIIINSPSFPPFETIDLRRGIRMKSKKKKKREKIVIRGGIFFARCTTRIPITIN